jgi:hypothetical protein
MRHDHGPGGDPATALGVTDRFITSLAVDVNELRELLADDLEARVEALRSDVAFLAESGVAPATIIEGVEL